MLKLGFGSKAAQVSYWKPLPEAENQTSKSLFWPKQKNIYSRNTEIQIQEHRNTDSEYKEKSHFHSRGRKPNQQIIVLAKAKEIYIQVVDNFSSFFVGLFHMFCFPNLSPKSHSS